jgi:homoserine kinase
VKTVTVRAPASTANLGPGFDCAAAALDLWNELSVDERLKGAPFVEVEGEGADEVPRGPEHLALRAFARVAPLDGFRFRFVNRIPLERGLGSSAAAVAAGLVAGALVAGRSTDPTELLALGLTLEGHADNLAAALGGGVCLTWTNGAGPRTARVAADTPLAPIVVVPEERVSTQHSRSRLPFEIKHSDAVAAAAQAALLGAALAAGDSQLHASALHDLLHEPYREADAPLLVQLRADLPAGARGVTLSGSGPSVVVWADKERAAEVARELERKVGGGARVLALRVANQGAGAHEP